MDITEIQSIIPHRYPFLLIDRIVEIEPLKRIVAIKNVTMNEYFFQGHFPGSPVLPGVLIVEALAQAGAVLLFREVPDRENKLLYFTRIDEAKFRKPVVPGDQLAAGAVIARVASEIISPACRATIVAPRRRSVPLRTTTLTKPSVSPSRMARSTWAMS